MKSQRRLHVQKNNPAGRGRREMGMKCTQEDCNEDACYRYVWPGEDKWSYACEEHKNAVINIAGVMGFAVMVELYIEEALCEK